MRTVLAVNAAASAWLGDARTVKLVERPPNVVGIPDRPAPPPPAGDRSLLFLIGNSHTYGLPGLKQGQPLRPETSGTLIDELAHRIEPVVGSESGAYYRLSYPNFLPFEILTTVGHLAYQGLQPKVVVMGWTWANMSRRRDLRYDVYSVYRDPEFVGWLTEQIEAMTGTKHAAVMEAISGEVARPAPK